MAAVDSMISREQVRKAARSVRSGGVILYPTETVYGLGGDPTDPAVVERIRRIKDRPAAKPMLLLTDRWERVAHWLANVASAQERLMEVDPPLPVTIVFDTRAPELAAVRGSASTIGIRRTGDDFCRRLIGELDTALISTSANRAGKPAARRFSEVDPEIIAEVDMVVDAGRPLRGKPSTVVAFDEGEPRILRRGAVTEAELVRLLAGRP